MMDKLNGHTTKVLIGLLTALTLLIWNDLRGDVQDVKSVIKVHESSPHAGAAATEDVKALRELITQNRTELAKGSTSREAILARLDRIETKVDRLLER